MGHSLAGRSIRLIAFPGHAGRCWSLARWRSLARKWSGRSSLYLPGGSLRAVQAPGRTDHRVHRRGVLGESRARAGGRGRWPPTAIPSAAGGETTTTNQRMEITAALEAVRTLTAAHPGVPIDVVCDSTYVVNCFRDRWWVKWEANGWRTSARKPVANADLWAPLVDARQGQPGDVPLGEGAQRRSSQRPRRPARRRGDPPLNCQPALPPAG